MHSRNPPSKACIARRRRVLATAIDAMTGLLFVISGIILAIAWMLFRTDLGLYDVGDTDALVGASLIASAVPAWFTWLSLRIQNVGSTPGQSWANLSVSTDKNSLSLRRQFRLLCHPLAVPVWSWITGTTALTDLPWLWLLPATITIIVLVGFLTSLTILIVRPRMSSLHDLIAGTKLIELD